MQRIEADVDPRNMRSLHLLERPGFRGEGLLRECRRLAGEVQDRVVPGLPRGEFQATRSRRRPRPIAPGTRDPRKAGSGWPWADAMRARTRRPGRDRRTPQTRPRGRAGGLQKL